MQLDFVSYNEAVFHGWFSFSKFSPRSSQVGGFFFGAFHSPEKPDASVNIGAIRDVVANGDDRD